MFIRVCWGDIGGGWTTLGNLYPHQREILRELCEGKRYIVAAPRTGKTRPVLEFFRESERVLVLTKKAAIGGWESEARSLNLDDRLGNVGSGWLVTNYEQVKTKGFQAKYGGVEWDGLVLDEAHVLGTYPKPNQLVLPVRDLLVKGPRIAVSATPCPETYSQLYHQDKAMRLGLWEERSFYKFHKKYGIPDLIKAHGRMIETYKRVKDSVWDTFRDVCVVVDRKNVMPDFIEAEDELVSIEAPEVLEMCEQLMKDQVLKIDDRYVVADTPLGIAQKCQQICNGVVLDDEGEPLRVNTVKRDWINKRFKGVKLAILTTFRAETTFYGVEGAPEAFLEGFSERFVGNYAKYSSGVDLSPAESLVFTGCPWSALHFFQGRDRLLNVKRSSQAKVYYPVIKGGVDEMIFNRVAGDKKDFVASCFSSRFP